MVTLSSPVLSSILLTVCAPSAASSAHCCVHASPPPHHIRLQRFTPRASKTRRDQPRVRAALGGWAPSRSSAARSRGVMVGTGRSIYSQRSLLCNVTSLHAVFSMYSCLRLPGGLLLALSAPPLVGAAYSRRPLAPFVPSFPIYAFCSSYSWRCLSSCTVPDCG